MKEASALIRILDEQRKRHEKEDAENDAIVERLHTAYRNTVDDGWNELLAKKRLLFPERSQSDDVAVQTINLHTKSRFPKMRIGFAFALCALLVGVSFLFARTTVRPPQVFWGTIPPPRLSIVGTDTLYPFAERLFETDGMIVPAGKYPNGISLNLSRRMEIARGEEVHFIVRYVFEREDKSLIIGVAVLPRDEIFKMAGLGYRLTDYSFHR